MNKHSKQRFPLRQSWAVPKLLCMLLFAACLAAPQLALASDTGGTPSASTIHLSGMPLVAQAGTPIYKAKIEAEPVVFTGKELKPNLTITYDGMTLQNKSDYTISVWRRNINAGTGIVLINGAGRYSNSVAKTFAIGRADISNAEVEFAQDVYEYTGAPNTPIPSKVVVNGRKLSYGYDYKITYQNNVNPSSTDKTSGEQEKGATATLTGIGNYMGTATASFAIGERIHLSPDEIDIRLPTYSYTYTGDKITPMPTVYTKNKLLQLGRDYTVTYDGDYENVGNETASIIVNCKGLYDGHASKAFSITPAAIANEQNDLAAEYNIILDTIKFVANGKEQKPSVAVEGPAGRLVPDIDYTLKYRDNVEPGTATITITGKGNYTGTTTAGFVIVSADSKDVTGTLPYVLADINSTSFRTSYTIWTGSAVRPLIISYVRTIPDATSETGYRTETKTLVEGVDYAVVYRNNVNVGKATAYVEGLNSFTGNRTYNFVISKVPLSRTIAKLSQTKYVYNFGEEFKPTPTVTYNKKELVQGKKGDYVVLGYTDNVNAGTAKVSIVGTGKNFLGAGELELSDEEKELYGTEDPAIRNLSFTIDRRTITDGVLTLSQSTYKYNAAPCKPDVTLKITTSTGTHTLEADRDYAVTYTSNTEAGTATAKVTGKGNFKGTLTKTFTITPAPISDVTISVKKATYTGDPIKAVPVLKIGDATVKAANYTVEGYENNVNAGSAAVIYIKPRASLYGETTRQLFTINRRSIASSSTATLSNTTYVYDGTAHKPTVTSLVVLQRSLTLSTDYKISKYTNNTNASTKDAPATVVLAGLGNYGGSLAVPFKIEPLSLNDSSVTTRELTTVEYKYNASERKPGAKVVWNSKTLVAGTDYAIGYKNNVDAGKATATVVGRGNFKDSFVREFEIKPAPMSDATITFGTTYWTGKAVQPRPTVTIGGSKIKTSDFSTSNYRNNVNVGSNAAVTISGSGTGNVTGSVEKNFTISKKPIDKATITLGTKKYSYNGTERKPTVKVELAGYGTLVENNDYTVSYEKNIDPGVEAKAVVTGVGNYSGKATANFEIVALPIAGATIQLREGVTYEYNGEEQRPLAVKVEHPTYGALTYGTDFVYRYSNNVNAGQATLSIEGRGIYAGTASTTFTIVPKSIDGVEVSYTSGKNYAYRGRTINPPVKLVGYPDLVSGTDYTVRHSNNEFVGTATTEITGKGNYTGSTSSTFNITQLVLTDNNGVVATLPNTSFTYSGLAQTPKVSFSGKYSSLNKYRTDYTVAYSNNTNVGEATVTITGKNEYCTGTKTLNFTIEPLSLDGHTIVFDQKEYDYTGSEIKPTVKFSAFPNLVAGTDYSVTYENNVQPSESNALVTVTGIGNCTGTTAGNFVIKGKPITQAKVTLDADAYDYDGEEHKPKVVSVVLDGFGTLVEGTDYVVAYQNYTNAGTGSVIVSGKGNYSGTATKQYTIRAKSLTGATVTLEKTSYEYVSATSFIRPKVTKVELGTDLLYAGQDYVPEYQDNENVGKGAKVIVKGIGNYTGTIIKTFTITAKSIKDATVLIPDTVFDYTGKAIEAPVKSVSLSVSGTLTKDRDYTVAWTKNTNVGTDATVTITGKGNYTGSVVRKFTIQAKSIASATVTLDTTSYVYNGEERKPKVNSVNLLGFGKLVENTDYTVSYEDNIAAGDAKVIITGIGNYGGTAQQTFKITRS